MYDIYTIKNGDTIESIANKYNVNPYVLYQLNGVNSDFYFTPGKNIVVPKTFSLYFDYYTIKKGDNLYKISEKYSVDYMLLALINGLNVSDYIYPNQVIAVPKNGVSYYIVEENDTLTDISNKLNANSESILGQNNSLYLLPGQLIVYKPN